MEPVRGYDEATVPGTIEHRKSEEYAREGVPMGLDDLERFAACGRELGVEVEWD